jgi:hypothetical protein
VAYKADLYLPSLTKTVSTELKVTMGVGSLEYSSKYFQFATEYARWWGEFDSNLPTILVPVHVTHERYYGMASFRSTEWLHSGVYHSVTYPNMAKHENAQDSSLDTAVFSRVDLTPNWLFKLEWHYIDGTSNLSASVNDNTPTSALPRRWQMFMAKTTIYF